MSDEREMCGRTGCSRYLRRDNTSGVCSTNCESMDAPPSHRAKNVQPAKKSDDILDYTPGSPSNATKAEKPKLDVDAVKAKFIAVTKALNLDAEVILAEAMQGWMDGLSALLNGEAEEE